MFNRLIAAWKQKIENDRHYRRLIAEIESLNARDLQELRADPLELRRQAWNTVYGEARG